MTHKRRHTGHYLVWQDGQRDDAQRIEASTWEEAVEAFGHDLGTIEELATTTSAAYEEALREYEATWNTAARQAYEASLREYDAAHAHWRRHPYTDQPTPPKPPGAPPQPPEAPTDYVERAVEVRDARYCWCDDRETMRLEFPPFRPRNPDIEEGDVFGPTLFLLPERE